MTKREDGKETRRRLLTAACEVFAQKGYRDAKVADICRRAGANVAAVNYYFSNKASLYAEAWRYAFQEIAEPDFSELANASPQERLRENIKTIMKTFSMEGKGGHFSRIYMMELVNPTGLIPDSWREMIDPRRQRLHNLIREIMGPKADVQSILFCELSIVNQCRALLTVMQKDLEYLLDQPLGPDLILSLIHI